MNKFKLFWIKVFHYIKKFPVLVFLAFFIPTSIYTVRYLFANEVQFNHLYYFGERLKVNHDKFHVTNIKPLFKVLNISSYSNYQGGACYENYYALCSNNYECLLIYDMKTNKVEHTIYTNETNTDYHCNTMFFGTDFFSAEDKFPLLYISQENAYEPCTIVCRIYQIGGVWKIKVVSTIIINFDKNNKLYYPNSYFDYSNGILYYAGYTKNSYFKSDDNKLRFHSFYLPDFRYNEVRLNPNEALATFEVDSETATQGGFVSDGYLYQTFSGLSEAAFPFKKEGETPKLRITNLKEGKILTQIEDLRVFGAADEFENIAIADNGKLYAHGNTHLQIYEFEYSDN